MPRSHDPRSLVPPALGKRRNAGDAWITADDGTKYWGRFGAAGIACLDRDRGLLLQHRAAWSHHGDTWGFPGGALHEGEDAITGALREAHEEASVPQDAIRPRFTTVADKGVWSYTTVVADVTASFEPEMGDAESIALEWVPLEELAEPGPDRRPLHPALENGMASLLEVAKHRPHLVIDAANVVGSVPDGWWKDRAGAATRLIEQVDVLAGIGFAASDLGLPAETWFPRVTVVAEGQARGVSGTHRIDVVAAPGEGDDAVVQVASAVASAGEQAMVVTSDRELQSRATAAGADVRSAGWLIARYRS